MMYLNVKPKNCDREFINLNLERSDEIYWYLETLLWDDYIRFSSVQIRDKPFNSSQANLKNEKPF